MYTMYPLQGTADHHGTFYFLSIIIFFLAIIFAAWCYSDSKRRQEDKELSPLAKVLAPTIASFILILSGTISFTTGSTYRNEKVTADLVKSFEALENTKVGKHRYENLPKMFVIYKTPDGEVSFNRSNGVVYPDKVILYKN